MPRSLQECMSPLCPTNFMNFARRGERFLAFSDHCNTLSVGQDRDQTRELSHGTGSSKLNQLSRSAGHTFSLAFSATIFRTAIIMHAMLPFVWMLSCERSLICYVRRLGVRLYSLRVLCPLFLVLPCFTLLSLLRLLVTLVNLWVAPPKMFFF